MGVLFWCYLGDVGMLLGRCGVLFGCYLGVVGMLLGCSVMLL